MERELQADGGRARSGEPDNGASPEEVKKYLIFREGPASLAVSIEAVKRVYDVEGGFPPRTPGSRMIDLVEIVGIEAVIAHKFWVEMETAAGRSLMPVEDVEGIRELNLAVPVAYPPLLRRPETEYIRRLFFDGLRMICEVDWRVLPGFADSSRDRRRQGAAAAREGAGAETASPAARLLIFQAGEQKWGIDLPDVLQVVIRDELHYLVSAGRWIKGAVYYGEQAVPVISPATLAGMLLGGEPPDEEFGLVVLAETREGLLGLGCDRILEVAELDAEAGPGPARYRSVIPGRNLGGGWTRIDMTLLKNLITGAVSARTR